jgi:O-antigen ligase
MMMYLPLALYAVLFIGAAFAPLRWSIICYLLLSTIDLGSLDASIGALNTAKAMLLPVWMLWRLRFWSGPRRVGAAPIFWGLLTLYVAIASSASLFPAYAIKLVGHMVGSLVICLMLIRAARAGFLGLQTIFPVTVGTLGMAVIHWFLVHDWGGEPDRLTSFAGAQSFAAFAVALYAGSLAGRSLRTPLKIAVCASLLVALLLNGSRLWVTGFLLVTLMSIFVSRITLWLRVLTFGLIAMAGSVALVEFDSLMTVMEEHSSSNRIAAALGAFYQGDRRSTGLGTYNLRRDLYRRSIDAIEASTLPELLLGHGTCNGALIAATLSKDPDPNRAMHNEWLRALYEWGLVGLTLWILFIAALGGYAIRALRGSRRHCAVPLLIYLPAFCLGLTGENFIAAAGNLASVGLLMLIGIASLSRPWPEVRREWRLRASSAALARGWRAAFPAATPALMRPAPRNL